MSCTDNIMSQEINKTVANLKRKADLETIERDNCSQVSTKSKIEDESRAVVMLKKQCSWRPPLKNEIEGEDNIECPTIASQQISTDAKSPEISIPIANQLSEQENENRESTLANVPASLSNYNIDKEEENETTVSLSLGSMETLPIAVFNNNDEFELKNTDDESISSEKESEKKFENQEKIDSDEGNICPAVESVECNQNILSDNVYSNPGKSDLGEFISVDEASFLKPTPINERFDNEAENLSEQKDLNNENMSGYETMSNDISVTERNVNVDVAEGVRSGAAGQLEAFTIDDTFDFTHSQLAKLEGDVSTAISQKHLIKPNTNWIRIKQQQKTILKKLIREVDELNESIVQATNELRSQLCKSATYNVRNATK
ncbi:hypothetical protein O3M35_002947 [Rhynocoris fuscipes]|uniref:Uncharacterized protein n=1 Tax=Rhynocoris fuscipes TaxID=488301 RepID=A0AAW1CIN9_9HEMI